MEVQKKGFMIYFDSVPLLMMLPDEQLGRMFKKLFGYADTVAKQPEVRPDAVKEEVEEDMTLSDGAKMAFHFMAGYIYRDTQRWWSTTMARLRREEERQSFSQRSAESPYTVPLPGRYP